MPRYRKRPVIIDAILWEGYNLQEVIDLIGLHPSVKDMPWEDYEQLVRDEGLKIFTLEGPLHAAMGDYIIRGVAGEAYPCKPEIFKATYELVEDENG